MLRSEIRIHNGNPALFIEDSHTPAMAYTTYFEERSRCKDFADAGYRIFFVNAYFTKLPINPTTGFSPCRIGVFDDPENPDYSEFEDAVRKILQACPDAVIFPRIYVSMPAWWVNSHPEDVIPTEKGGCREILFSEAFRQDGGDLLSRLIRHIKAADYAHRVGGWMLCGGTTQEWIFRHYRGGICDGAAEAYRRWAREYDGTVDAPLPRADDYLTVGEICPTSENARRYALFCNLALAQTLDHFARITKQESGCSQVVGAFYGYTYEEFPATFGSYGLRAIIDSPNLDFFSSPNAYTSNRAFGIDWADMMPVDSLKLHGKLAFIECDIRTYLTTGVQRARPGEYPGDIYGDAVWAGPPTAALSREALRKSFAHQLTKASAIWWFDMWGGWYQDPLLMTEMARLKEIYDTPPENPSRLPAQVVFFADEQSYANRRIDFPAGKTVKFSRLAMGKAGAPFDSCMVEDAEAVLKNYTAAVFPFPLPSEAGKRAMALCRELGIPYLAATTEHPILTVAEIRTFLKASGVHLYTEEEDVVYAGNGYLGLHSATGGTKRLELPGVFRICPVFGADIPEQVTDTLSFALKENGTALFSVHKL